MTSKAKSEGNGVLENEAPASKTIGSGAGSKVGWMNTESEAATVVGAEATTVGVVTEVNGGVVAVSPMRVAVTNR